MYREKVLLKSVKNDGYRTRTRVVTGRLEFNMAASRNTDVTKK